VKVPASTKGLFDSGNALERKSARAEFGSPHLVNQAPAVNNRSLAEAAGMVVELAALLPDEQAAQRDRIIGLAARVMVNGEFPQHTSPEHEQQAQERDQQ